MITSEQQAYIDQMYRDRGFSHDFHQVLAAEDFEFLKAYDNLIRAAYINKRSLDEKTKELLYIVAVTAMKGSVEHIKIHIKLALERGATKKEILEALEICIPTASVPAFMIGYEAWKQMVNPDRVVPKKE